MLLSRFSNFIRRAAAYVLNRILDAMLARGGSPRLMIRIQNLQATVIGTSIRFQLGNRSDGFGSTREGDIVHYFSDPKRGLRLYRSGLRAREKSLFRTYRLEHVPLDWNDVIVDCGANYGDLWLGLAGKIDPKGYIAIEPNILDFIALRRNVPAGANLINKALGRSAGQQEFFLATERGDSSLIEPSAWDSRVQVEVVTMDDLVESLGLSKIKLFKLEAEGYEPEILLGAGKALNLCEYVAIDGGYERGVGQEQTFTILTNMLTACGFEMLDVYFRYGRALFRRKSEYRSQSSGVHIQSS